MFNPDGTHRPDAAIAAEAARAIAQLIKDGVMKPQNAPATPLKGFDDANKYIEKYPGAFTESTPTAPVSAPAVSAPVKPADCPADLPCASTPAKVEVSAVTPAPSEQAAAPVSEPPQVAVPRKANSAGTGAGTGAKPAPGEPPYYVLGPNDVVGVFVFEERTVPGTYTIGPDGRISMPLIGTFRVVGLTVPELSDLIAQKLHDDGGVLEPVVNVQLLRSNSKQYTIVGGLGRTGPVPLLRDTSVLDAIAAAGGFKDFANKKDVQIRRSTQTFHFNYLEVLKGKNMAQNIQLEDGDLIIVKE